MGAREQRNFDTAILDREKKKHLIMLSLHYQVDKIQFSFTTQKHSLSRSQS